MDREGEPGTAEAMNEATEPDTGLVHDDHLGASAGSDTEVDAVGLDLPAQSRYIRLARLVGAGLANELGYGVDRLDDVRLAIGEACGLAVHAGAVALSLRYALDQTSLAVTVEAPTDQAGGRLDPEYTALVEQVLTVACSTRSIERDERQMTIRLTFSDGS
jgi:serine/threonine-protein kinase RsbW